MSRELEVTRVDEKTVRVKIATDTERDLSLEHDATDVIMKVASAMRWAVSISEMSGDADVES